MEYSPSMEMDYSAEQIVVWTCMTCHDIFPGNGIVRHFKVHPPSKYPGITEVDEELKSEFQAVVTALMNDGTFRELSYLKCNSSTELSPSSVKESSVAPSPNGAIDPISRATSPTNSFSTICSSDAPSPKKYECPSIVAPRKVAKKSCSGLKPKKHKKDKKREDSSSTKPKAIARKSCSGLKISHGNDKLRKLLTNENSNSQNNFEHRSRETLPNKPKKAKVGLLDRKSFIYDSELKKPKKSRAKNESIKREPKKKFLKPPLIRPNPSKTTKILEAMQRMKGIMQEQSPSISTLKEAMLDSFPYRRHLYGNLPDIRSTFAEFPALHLWEILKRDFELFKRANFDELNWKLSKELEITYEMSRSKYYLWPDPILQKASELYRDSPSDELLRDMKMMCFAFDKMNGKLDGVLYKVREKGRPPFSRMTPTIDIRGDYGTDSTKISIFCEGNEITKAPNMYEAVLCMYSVYWIFNLCYERSCQPFFETFDSMIGE